MNDRVIASENQRKKSKGGTMNIVENQSRNSYTPGFLTNMEKKPGKSFAETAKQSFLGALASEKKSPGEEQAEGIGKASGQEAKKMVEAYQKEIRQALLRDQVRAFGGSNKEKEKKHTLFTSENGVFSDKTLAEAAAQCSAETLDAPGTLTEEQIADFREKYDVENLSDEDYEQLLTELVEQNIISQQDKMKQFLKSAPPAAAHGLITAADDKFFSYASDRNNRLEKLQKEMAECQAYIAAIENGRCSVHGASLWETKHFYEEEYTYTKKIADILEQLKAGGTSL